MIIAADTVLAALEGAATVDPTADFSIVDSLRIGRLRAHFGVTPSGARALLVPVPAVPGPRSRSTKNVTLRMAAHVEFVGGGQSWREPAVIIECRDLLLLGSFSAMVAAILGRLSHVAPPAWNDVVTSFSEWEALLSRRRLLDESGELGLWGELWCMAHSDQALSLLDGWCGPAGALVDFRLDAMSIEVKTSSRPCVHHVSQKQVADAADVDEHYLISLHVRVDSVLGASLPELVRGVRRLVGNAPDFEEKLAAVGYAREDEDAYARRLVVVGAPPIFPACRVPRVRKADPGVTELRFRVELDPENAIQIAERRTILARMGLLSTETTNA